MKLFIAGIGILGLFGFSLYHTWHQTTPERLMDPINWAVAGVYVVIYFILRTRIK